MQKRESQKQLSELYRKVMRFSYNKKLPMDSRTVSKWARLNGILGPIRTLATDRCFKSWFKLMDVVNTYNEKVILEGIKYPGKIRIRYLGDVSIEQVNSITGKPRVVPDGQGGFKQVVDTVFTKTPKYLYRFTAVYGKIRVGLRSFMASGYYMHVKSKYLPIAYKEHPEGRFYNLN